MENVKKILGEQITYSDDPYAATEQADALIIATEWSVFRTPDFEQLKSRLRQPLVFDGRNLYDVDKMAEMGFDYHSIGRKSTHDRNPKTKS